MWKDVDCRADLKAPASRKVEQVFLSVLNRPPTDPELARWVKWVEASTGREGIEDLVWTLINSTEFVTRH